MSQNMPNPFQNYFDRRLRGAGWTSLKRGGILFWRKPGEKGVIYDSAEAVAVLVTDLTSGPKRKI